MSGELIPPPLEQFILKSIDSIAQLEALLLLAAGPDERWTVTAIAARLYVSEPEAGGLLDRLVAAGLIASESETYRYHPATADLDALVKQVADVYRKHLVPVTNLIHAKPRTRVQEFADAFKLRKDDVRKDEE